MKRFLVMVALLFIASIAVNAGVKDKVLLYLPNRILDATDIFSLGLGIGPAAKLELRATRACDFGGGVGAAAYAVKDYNRQYGGCLQNGYDWSFTCLGDENEQRTGSRWVKSDWYQYTGIPSYKAQEYDRFEGSRDYWEIGGEGGAGLIGRAAIHPINIADFITGWFFIDLAGNDITSEDMD